MNLPYDRPVIPGLSKPNSANVNRMAAHAALLQTELLRLRNRVRNGNGTVSVASSALGTDPSRGFIGDSFFVTPGTTAMTIDIQPGIGYLRDPSGTTLEHGGIGGVADQSVLRPLVLGETETITLDAAHATLDRIDLIEVAPYRHLDEPGSTPILNELTGEFGIQNPNSGLSYALDGLVSKVAEPGPSSLPIGYRPGTPGGTPAAPAPTPGYIAIAYVYVEALATSITAAAVKDARRLLLGAGIPITVTFTYVGGPAGGITAAATKVSAPPGIQVAVYGGTTNSDVAIVLLAGDAAYTNLHVVGMTGSTRIGSAEELYQPTVSAAPTYALVNAFTGAYLAGGSPAAVGALIDFQFCWSLGLRTLRITTSSGSSVPVVDYDVHAGTVVTVAMLLVPKEGA